MKKEDKQKFDILDKKSESLFERIGDIIESQGLSVSEELYQKNIVGINLVINALQDFFAYGKDIRAIEAAWKAARDQVEEAINRMCCEDNRYKNNKRS